VVGVDVAADVVAAAADHVAAVGATNVTVVAGDVRPLDIAPRGGADVVHAHQVLQHLRDPVGALAAMAGLARRDGLVAARDADYGAMTWGPADERRERGGGVYHHVT